MPQSGKNDAITRKDYCIVTPTPPTHLCSLLLGLFLNLTIDIKLIKNSINVTKQIPAQISLIRYKFLDICTL